MGTLCKLGTQRSCKERYCKEIMQISGRYTELDQGAMELK